MGAFPPAFFVPRELFKPIPADGFQVLEHAHAIFGAVALIQVFHSGAWKLLTLVAKTRIGRRQVFTIGDRAAAAVFGFIRVVFFGTATAGLFLTEKADAKSAIHSAGCNQSFIVNAY